MANIIAGGVAEAGAQQYVPACIKVLRTQRTTERAI